MHAQIDRGKASTALDIEAAEDHYISYALERLAETVGETSDLSEAAEHHAYYAKHKMNINQPDYEVLASVFQLNDYQLYHLRRYMDLYGPLYSIYELAAVEGFDKMAVLRLYPYIVFEARKEEAVELSKRIGRANQMLLLRYGRIIEKSKGYTPDSLARLSGRYYEGSPDAYLFKYRFQDRKKLSVGFTAEKDAGEALFKGSNRYGFDFYSFHLYYKGNGFLKTLAIGDYKVYFGQGLSMYAGFRLPLASHSGMLSPLAKSLSPYTSSGETHFLRGVAVEFGYKRIKCSLFGSYRYLDAGVSDSLDREGMGILSLQTTGLHRTKNEIAKEKTIRQFLSGSCLHYTHRLFHVGLGVFYSHLNHPLKRTLYPYNQFAFHDQALLNVSFSYRALIKKISLYGEQAISDNGGFALYNACILYMDPRFSCSLVHRYYAVNYQAIQANAYAQSSGNTNENALLWSCQTTINKYINIQAYVDYFHFMWLAYRIDAPSQGYEIFLKSHFTLHTNCETYLQYRCKSKALNRASAHLNHIVDTKKQQCRLHVNYQPIASLRFIFCAEMLLYRQEDWEESKHGFLMYQDIKWTYKRFQLYTRFALFDTPDYDTRLYAYENDVLYTVSVPAYYYTGNRIYGMLKVEINSYLDVWIRLSQSFYKNKHRIGSDLQEIDTNHKSFLQLQLIYSR